MQIIKLFDGTETTLQEDEAENVKNFWLQNSDKPIMLRSGLVLNPKSISSIGEPERIAMWDGYPLDKSGKSFMRDGERIFLEPHNFSEIEYKIHPKYGNIKEEKAKQLNESKYESFVGSLRK